jgi:hypothetical protein
MTFSFYHRSPKIHHKQTSMTFCKNVMYYTLQINFVTFLQKIHTLQHLSFLMKHGLPQK